MDQEVKDKGIIAVMLKEFETDHYPRAKLLKQQVDNGAVLDQYDLIFLDETLEVAHRTIALISRHPEYASLAKEIILMYEEIMSKSQQNSNKA